MLPRAQNSVILRARPGSGVASACSMMALIGASPVPPATQSKSRSESASVMLPSAAPSSTESPTSE